MKSRFDLEFIEEAEDFSGVFFDAQFPGVPTSRRRDSLKGGDVEVVFHVDTEVVNDVALIRQKSPLCIVCFS